MFLFVILVAAYFTGLGFYVQQNVGYEDVHFFEWTWQGVPTWMPAFAAGVGMFALMLLAAAYRSIRAGGRRRTMWRLLLEHESMIGELRDDTSRLRSEVDRLWGRGGRGVGA